MNDIKFGIQQPEYNFKPEETFDRLSNIVQTAESNGFESFWVMDHFMQLHFLDPESKAPMLEGWTVLSNLAGITKEIKLGTLVTCTSYRNPAYLAKIAASLDVLSGGRLIMGIGAGWFEKEYIAYGYEFPKYSERVKMLNEAVQILKKMWTEEMSSFEGEYFSIKDAICNPKPLQKPHPPILIGGGGLKTLRVAAEHADMCNFFGRPEEVNEKVKIVEKYCSEIGRDPTEIIMSKMGGVIITETKEELNNILKMIIRPGFSLEELEGWMIFGTPEKIVEKLKEFIDAGVTYFTLNFPGSDPNKIKMFGERVIPEF